MAAASIEEHLALAQAGDAEAVRAAYVLKANGTGWDVVTETSVTRTPIGVLETTSNGWRDPFVTVSGGGMPVDASGGEVLIAAEDEGEVLE